MITGNIAATGEKDVFNQQFKIIVIGASAGGFEAIKKLVAGLPANFAAPVFIVWHMAPTLRGILPDILNRLNTIYAANAYDGEPVMPNRIYVAPPDHHLLVQEGKVRVTHGPKENRFRPAVDPLFRSAAHAYGPRVIGIVLSGALADGTAGLWAIKQYGGVTIVQHPYDAEIPAMPENAIREVQVDHVLPVSEMARLLVQLTEMPARQQKLTTMKDDEKMKMEIRIAAEDNTFEKGIMQWGELTPFTCPECHGVLMRLTEGGYTRFRCHTGHAFSADSLLLSLTESIEDSLYNAIRGIEENIMLLNHIGDHLAENNQPKMAGMYFKKAKEAGQQAGIIRQAVTRYQQLNNEGIQHDEKAPPA